MESPPPWRRDVPPGLPFRWDLRAAQRGLNFTLTTAAGDIDLLAEVAGGGINDILLPHSLEVEAFAVRFRCINLPKLIKLKRAASRPKDIEAIAELEALSEDFA